MKQSVLGTLACAAAATLIGGSAASAATLNVTNLGPVTGMTGWTAYTVSATATLAGYGNATVVDLSSNGQGIFGPMHQRWTFVVDEETEQRVYTKSPQDASTSPTTGLTRFDSHFLFTNAQLIGSTFTPDENNNVVNQAGGPADTASSDYGLGSSLKATVGFLPASQAPTINLAYLVIQNGQSVSVSGNLANGVGTKDFFSGTVGATAVPEPGLASFALIGSAAGLLARRQRQA